MSSPFFIIGTGRCGTQMLRNILESWPDVKVLPETHFLIPLYDEFGLESFSTNSFLTIISKLRGSRGQKWINVILKAAGKTPDSFENKFKSYAYEQGFYKANISEHFKILSEFLYGKSFRIGDKTPHYGSNIDIIKNIWPDAQFIHLVRDGVDVASSMRSHPGFKRFINHRVRPANLDRVMYEEIINNFSSKTPSLKEALYFWEDVLKETRKNIGKLNSEDYIEIKYEDLNLYPHKTIRKIADFLDLKNKTAFKKAVKVPRPFPEKRQVKKVSETVYKEYYSLVKETMALYNYPYQVAINRNFIDKCREINRGKKFYFNQIIKISKSLVPDYIKQMIKKMVLR